MRKIVKLQIVLNMLPTEFSFDSQEDARDFALLMQKSAVKNMRKVLNLPEELHEENPTVPGFEILGMPEGAEEGFMLGEIPATVKVRKPKGSGAATEGSENATSGDEDTEEKDPEDEGEKEPEVTAPAPTRTRVTPKKK